MRLLLLTDMSAVGKESRINIALERIKEDYKEWTDVKWVYEYANFTGLTWEYYMPDSLGISFSIINTETKRIWNRNPYAYDHVIFLVDPIHWKNGADKIGGWNLGNPYNKLHVQIVKVTDNDSWLYRIFAMEIAHVINDLARVELGLFRITDLDFDYGIIHGEHKDWGIPNANSKTGYFTNYDYTKVIKTFGTYVKTAYLTREMAYHTKLQEKVTLLQRIVNLLTRLKRLQATPITEGELEGNPHHHV